MRGSERALILRPTTPDDFPEVQALFRDPAFEGWGGPGFRSDSQLREKYLGARLPDVECFLIEVDDRVAGFTQLYADGSGAGMDLILLPAERGKGLGRQVVEVVLERVRARGRTHFVVDPSPEDNDAVAFWHAVGFRGQGVLVHHLDDTGESSAD
ncbi:GNAT family N-acetyltransferase [Curtobacterium sp. NPDC089991]|uniref:GNAT family N-acetyltransferase n=1 Tax=Curtobacterium sp. NPDC089991 TaxID=3363969 RepID=UPI003827DAC7